MRTVVAIGRVGASRSDEAVSAAAASNAARALAVRVAGECFGIGVGKAEIVRLEGGRPVLVPACGLSVSLSHSGTMVAAAVSDGAVGVGVQRQRPVRPGLIERYFAGVWGDARGRAEADAIELWSCMESAAKLTGLGIARFLREHVLHAEGSGWRVEASPATAEGLLAFTRVLWSDDRYVLSVASGRPGAIVEVRWFDADSASSASSS